VAPHKKRMTVWKETSRIVSSHHPGKDKEGITIDVVEIDKMLIHSGAKEEEGNSVGEKERDENPAKTWSM
jgi:hypothetical protein